MTNFAVERDLRNGIIRGLTMLILRFSLMLVVFVDIMGQGLILPIINTLLLDRSGNFLPSGMAHNTRELLYGVLLGIFLLIDTRFDDAILRKGIDS